ncbi:MAG TPA: ABC transporter permease [Acidimicrobiia bacterium]|nr:ABC transporter permease [Acidimicrobiia bacterium]
MAVRERELTELETGLDALEIPLAPRVSRARKIWRATWPKLLATALLLGAWQLVVWSGWKPETQIPPPAKAFQSLYDNWDVLSRAMWTTIERGFKGYSIALVIGVIVGAFVSRIPVLRAGVGSMITGLQTMPSIAWFLPAIVVFHLSEGAIYFVVVLGAAPAIANGLINGVDNIPPVLLRAGRVMGARRFAAFRSVILPAALPSFIGGMKQGWAFAWRSLLAGEIIGAVSGYSLGQQLQVNKDFGDISGLYAVMILIFVVGVVIDTFLFGFAERAVRRRYGLVDAAAT